MAILYTPGEPVELSIYKVFSKFTQQFTSDPVRLLDSNFIAPDGSYIVIKMNDIEQVSGRDGWYGQVDAVTQEQTTYNNFVGYASVYTYGQYALSKAQQVVYATKDRNLRKILNENGIGVSGTSRVRNASRAISGTEMEERAQFSVSFNFVQSNTSGNTDGFIDKVSTGGSLHSDYDGEPAKVTTFLDGTNMFDLPDILQSNEYYEEINIEWPDQLGHLI